MCLVALALVVLALPFSAESQQTRNVPRIGWLSVAGSSTAHLNEAFRQGLSELGYVEAKNVVIEYRSADTSDRLPSVAAELVHLKVDVIFAPGGPQPVIFSFNRARSEWWGDEWCEAKPELARALALQGRVTWWN